MLLVLAPAALLPATASASAFALDYRVALDPSSGEAHVVIATRPIDGRLIRVRIPLDRDRYHAVRADGDLSRDGDEVTWEVPREGGTLQYRVEIDHERVDFSFRQRGGEIYSSRGFADAALLVCDGEDSTGHESSGSNDKRGFARKPTEVARRFGPRRAVSRSSLPSIVTIHQPPSTIHKSGRELQAASVLSSPTMLTPRYPLLATPATAAHF